MMKRLIRIMVRWRQITLLWVVLLSSWVGEVQAAPVNLPYRNIQTVVGQLDKYVGQLMAKMGEPGCAVAVVYKGRIVFMKTYGVRDLRTKQRIDFDTVFQLGSVSKTFASTLAAILVKKGLLDVDAPVSRYLPYFSLNGIPANQLRVRHLLNHTTGIPRGGFNNQIEMHASHEQLIRSLQRASASASPGRQFDYHNVAYSVLDDVIARVTRYSYSQAMRLFLLNPLQMRDTSVSLGALLSDADRASPHVRARGRGWVPLRQYSNAYYAVLPAAGVNSSIHDMAQFLILQLGGYPSVLSPRQLANFHAPTIATPETAASFRAQYGNAVSAAYYGLGFRILQFGRERIVFHGGWLKGFTNFMGFIPNQEVGIVILHNSESRFATRVGMRFFQLFLGNA